MIEHSYVASFKKQVSHFEFGFESKNKRSINPFSNTIDDWEEQYSIENEQREIRK